MLPNSRTRLRSSLSPGNEISVAAVLVIYIERPRMRAAMSSSGRAQSTTEINGIINAIQRSTNSVVEEIEHSQSLAEQGAEHIEKAVTRLLVTTEQIGSLNEQMAELAAAAEQQSHATSSITGLMSDITQSVDEVSNNSQRASETSLQVKEQVTELNQQMATFKTA